MAMLERRSFLGACIAAAAAPVIIRTPGLLMPVKPALVWREQTLDLITLSTPVMSAYAMPLLVTNTSDSPIGIRGSKLVLPPHTYTTVIHTGVDWYVLNSISAIEVSKA